MLLYCVLKYFNYLFINFRLLNYVMKHGSATANTLGVIAVMYCGFGTLLSLGRGTDDELNTVTAATATGLLYKSSGIIKHFCKYIHY